MTTLIYRGIGYVRTARPVKREPQDLIYRGNRHDGLAQHSHAAAAGAEMRYRGVSYTRTSEGRVIPAVTPADPPLVLVAIPS